MMKSTNPDQGGNLEMWDGRGALEGIALYGIQDFILKGQVFGRSKNQIIESVKQALQLEEMIRAGKADPLVIHRNHGGKPLMMSGTEAFEAMNEFKKLHGIDQSSFKA